MSKQQPREATLFPAADPPAKPERGRSCPSAKCKESAARSDRLRPASTSHDRLRKLLVGRE